MCLQYYRLTAGGARDRTSSSIANVRHAWLPFKSDFSRVSGGKAQLSSHLLGFPMDGLCLPVRMTTWAGGSSACNWPRSPIQIKPRPTAGLFKGTTKDSILPGRIPLFPVGFGSEDSVIPGKIRLFPVGFGSERFGYSRQDSSVLLGKFRFLIRLKESSLRP